MRSNLPAPSQPWGMDVERRLGYLENTIRQMTEQLSAQNNMAATLNAINGATANVNIIPIESHRGQQPSGWGNGVREANIDTVLLQWPERGTQGLVLVSASYEAMSNSQKPEWQLGGSEGMTAANIPRFDGVLKVSCGSNSKQQLAVMSTYASMANTFYSQTMVCAFPITHLQYPEPVVEYNLLCSNDKGGLLNASTSKSSLTGAFITF